MLSSYFNIVNCFLMSMLCLTVVILNHLLLSNTFIYFIFDGLIIMVSLVFIMFMFFLV